MSRWTVLITLAAVWITAAGNANGFGGGIAIGMARLNDSQNLDTSFSATATLESDRFNVEEQIFYSPGKLREEMEFSGQDMVSIQRHDLGKLWMVMPQGFYMETPIDTASPTSGPAEQLKSFELVEHEAVGTDIVNGLETTRYRTSWQTDNGRFGGMSWITDDGIVVKADLTSEMNGQHHQMHFEITRLNRGEQPERLFEVPAGYRKMDLSGARGLGGLLGRQRGN